MVLRKSSLFGFGILLVSILFVGIVGCGKSASPNTKVTKENADKIKVNMTMAEVEAILGKGLDAPPPKNFSGTGEMHDVSFKKWEREKDGDAIDVGFSRDGKVVYVNSLFWNH